MPLKLLKSRVSTLRARPALLGRAEPREIHKPLARFRDRIATFTMVVPGHVAVAAQRGDLEVVLLVRRRAITKDNCLERIARLPNGACWKVLSYWREDN